MLEQFCMDFAVVEQNKAFPAEYLVTDIETVCQKTKQNKNEMSHQDQENQRSGLTVKGLSAESRISGMMSLA